MRDLATFAGGRIGAAGGPLLRPGDTCWRLAQARHCSVLIDGEAYYRAARRSLLEARHSIILLGWNFSDEARLPGEDEWPREFGNLLDALLKRRPELRVDIVLWDKAEYLAVGRRRVPGLQAARMNAGRINYVLDDAHPPLATHHQKVLVVDDAVAYCGGFDFAANRWDTRGHDPADQRRRMPSGARYDPHHDVMLAVDGEAARSLGDLGRERLRLATGEVVEPPPPGDAWPEGLEPDFVDVPVGIARTAPAWRDRPEIREVEALYLASIAAAQRTIYAESQYLASPRIGEALAERLAEPDGPEVVIVTPKFSPSVTEQIAMDNARTHITRRLREADRHGRFRLFAAVNEGREIIVHSKVMVVDDRLLRIGSSNLNSRSLGSDTECDLAIEAGEGRTDAHLRRAVARVRNDLVAEHLGTSRAQVAEAIGATGSLIGAIDRLNGRSSRRLAAFPPPRTWRLRDPWHNALTDPYRPPGWREGLLAAGVAVTGLAASLLLLRGLRRRRAARPRTG